MKLLICGDCSPTSITNPLFATENVPALFGNVAELFVGCDFSFVNLECALTESTNAIEKFGPNLQASPRTADTLKALGVTVCGLSNNHIFDFGIMGYRDTEANLKRVGLAQTGFGKNELDSRKNYLFLKDGETVCMIAVCEHEYSYALDDRMGARPFDCYDTMNDIAAAKKTADRVVVIYHGGKEHCRYPSPRLVHLCHEMAQRGADAVICQHSHCIGCYEQYGSCHILYGQGNFHFIVPNPTEGWNTSLAVELDTAANRIHFIPLAVDGCGIHIAAGSEKEAILSLCAQLNAQMQDGTYHMGWHDFCEQNRAPYTDAIAHAFTPDSTEQQNKRFGHYLDCEAHTDVWRELNKTANHSNERSQS